jgi:hypothetical protein
MLAAIFEVLIQFILEFAFEAAAEVLIELGLYTAEKGATSRVWNPVVVGAGYAILGGALGAVTFMVLPDYIIGDETLRAVGRVLSPIGLGFMLCLVSWIIKRRDLGEGFFRLDKFIHGVVFGAAYSAARYLIS